MRLFLCLIFLFVWLAITPLSGQILSNELEAEKEKNAAQAKDELEKNAFDLLEQALDDAARLKLPENRALVYVTTGDLLWSKNEKRARILFNSAASEIIQANNTSLPKDETSSRMQRIFGRAEIYNLRRMFLLAVAAHDAGLALQFLQTTRPSDVTAEMQNYYFKASINEEVSNPQIPSILRNVKVIQELQTEQNIITRAAEQDPQKAAKMIRESLTRDLSYGILSNILKVGNKDIELADKLLSEAFQKALSSDLSKRPADLFSAILLLNTFASSPQITDLNYKALSKLKVEDKALKDLANLIADTLMKSEDFDDYRNLSQVMKSLEKLLPKRIEQLRQKKIDLKNKMPDNVAYFEPLPSYNDPNATAETLLADAVKTPTLQMRGRFYKRAVSKAIAEGGDIEKFRVLLGSEPESKERDAAIIELDSQASKKLLEQGKFEEADKIIDRMAVNNSKIEQLVSFAITNYKLNTKESKEAALKLMDEARRMVKEFPDDKDEAAALLKIVAGYVIIDPSLAFSMLTPVIEQTNDLVSAGAALAKYNKQTRTFRDGEIIMINAFGALQSSIFGYGRQLKMLAQTDPKQTRASINKFRREDVRILANLFIAQGILKEKIGLEGATDLIQGSGTSPDPDTFRPISN